MIQYLKDDIQKLNFENNNLSTTITNKDKIIENLDK